MGLARDDLATPADDDSADLRVAVRTVRQVEVRGLQGAMTLGTHLAVLVGVEEVQPLLHFPDELLVSDTQESAHQSFLPTMDDAMDYTLAKAKKQQKKRPMIAFLEIKIDFYNLRLEF